MNTEMFTWINITRFFIVLAFVVIFLWDSVVIFFAADYRATFSFTIYTISKEHPIIPFAIGVLCGHVFWPLGGGG